MTRTLANGVAQWRLAGRDVVPGPRPRRSPCLQCLGVAAIQGEAKKVVGTSGNVVAGCAEVDLGEAGLAANLVVWACHVDGFEPGCVACQVDGCEHGVWLARRALESLLCD